MSPEQCRQARQKLRWSRHDLAVAAGVPLIIIRDYEDGGGVVTIADCLEFVRAAFEAAEIGFPFELSDGRVTPAGVTYSPPRAGIENEEEVEHPEQAPSKPSSQPNDPAADAEYQKLVELIARI